MRNIELIDRLASEGVCGHDEFEQLFSTYTPEDRDYATSLAYRVTRENFGTQLRAWGVVDITNACNKDCYYCGLGRANASLERYRLTPAEVVECCARGHDLGFRTFVLRGGDDPEYTDDVVVDLIWAIRKRFGDSAIALALGERTRATYQRWFDAGADRYLLRHESADAEHFATLHPRRMTQANRIRALEDLKAVGYATGSGMLVGTPGQGPSQLAQDMAFLADFDPAVVTVGPFLPARTSAFADRPAGSVERALFVLALVRLLLPDAGLPVVTAMATAHPRGRELAVMAGANIVMPSLTPASERDKFAEYDGRVTAGPEGAEGLDLLKKRLAALGYTLAEDPGELHRG